MQKKAKLYLTKKDLIIFFKINKNDIDKLIKLKLLKPVLVDGKYAFSLSNILNATFKYSKTPNKK